jgi:SNF2 family DNA or RNA helicase
MAKDERQESLRRIRESDKINIILVSFKAGSTGLSLYPRFISVPHIPQGLNLTACNHVILVDLWWNPALEEQAFDRAHRLGQQRDVRIYKLTIENTVEDRILTVHIYILIINLLRD